ncbi:MAG: hypothetical protein GVY13_02875 [Alphaproteobacteria bacterium]|jgi:hypothetical protein|nr:hypothetical protein [Alphaproteobacteria bacterium]
MRKPVKRRNPHAVALRRLGQKVIPNKKAYSRKGRSKDRPFATPALYPAAPFRITLA